MNIPSLYVIVADDDDDDLMIFRECFLEVCRGMELLMVNNGRKLVELLNTGIRPYAIFLDLNMPGISGFDCLLEIRKNAHLNATKVLILSTSTRKTEIDYCLNNGANNYLVKPDNMETLKSYIRLSLATHELII